ncbi:hypothetical protein Tco_1214155 [Tanacetum coccineum]
MLVKALRRFGESLRRVTYGAEAFLILTLFILCLDKVSTNHVKLVPLGKVCTAKETLETKYRQGQLPDQLLNKVDGGTFEQQPDLSHRPSPTPSPTPIVPDSIPEPTRENLGDHSSNDASLSGNEDDMTIQNVYDLCISLCQQVSDQAKEIKLLKAKITKLKKQAKPKAKGESSVQRDPLFEVLAEDKIDHMETENAQTKGRTRDMVDEDKDFDEERLSTEDEVSTVKEGVSTDFEKVSTDRPIVSTDGSKVSTDEQVEGTEEQNEGTEEIFESTEDQREGTEEKVESTAGQIQSTEDQTKEEIASKASQTSTQSPLYDMW